MESENSEWSSDWTKAKSEVTPQLIKKIGDVLVRLIKTSPEVFWEGKLSKIIAECEDQNSEKIVSDDQF